MAQDLAASFSVAVAASFAATERRIELSIEISIASEA